MEEYKKIENNEELKKILNDYINQNLNYEIIKKIVDEDFNSFKIEDDENIFLFCDGEEQEEHKTYYLIEKFNEIYNELYY